MDYIKTHSFSAIHTYLPIGSEVDFYPVIQELLEMNIKVVCPQTENKPVFKNLILTSLDNLEQGDMELETQPMQRNIMGTLILSLCLDSHIMPKNIDWVMGEDIMIIFLRSTPWQSNWDCFIPFNLQVTCL